MKILIYALLIIITIAKISFLKTHAPIYNSSPAYVYSFHTVRDNHYSILFRDPSNNTLEPVLVDLTFN